MILKMLKVSCDMYCDMLFRMFKKTSSVEDYPIQPVPFTSVKLTDNFWAPRIKKNADVTIPMLLVIASPQEELKILKLQEDLIPANFRLFILSMIRMFSK